MDTNMRMKFRLAICAALMGAFLSACRDTAERDDYAFLVEHMPEKDRGKVGEEYLRENVRLTREALAAAPWRDTIPENVFREYILPYSSINEDADDWRAPFREKFWPLVKDCRTTGEAVKIINANIGRTLGVYYSTRRDKPEPYGDRPHNLSRASTRHPAPASCDLLRR